MTECMILTRSFVGCMLMFVFPLQGILLACKVNWLDDPKLRDIAMTLEEFPISE